MSTPADQLQRVTPVHPDQVEHRRQLARGVNQAAGRLDGWASTVDRDWIPTGTPGAVQWVGDEVNTPRGLTVGVPAGTDPTGIHGFVSERSGAQGGAGGVVVVGARDQAPGSRTLPDPGLLANAPVEVAGNPVLLTGFGVYVEVPTLIAEEHYVLIGESTTLADGRNVAPLLIGPQYIPSQSQFQEDSRDIDLDGIGTDTQVVTMTLTSTYAADVSNYSLRVRLSEEGGRQVDFSVSIWLQPGGSGPFFEVWRDDIALTGSGYTVNVTDVVRATVNAGDVVEMRVSSTDTHPQSDGWVRGATTPSRIEVRQG